MSSASAFSLSNNRIQLHTVEPLYRGHHAVGTEESALCGEVAVMGRQG